MTQQPANPAVATLRLEHSRSGFGIGIAAPRVSWTISPEARDWRQTAYEVELTSARRGGRQTTGRVESEQSVLVAWPFAPLTSRDAVELRVRAWGADTATGWSEPLLVEAALLARSDWNARFVTPAWKDPTGGPSPLLRREFDVRGPVAKARLYVTALGVYKPFLNGDPVGDNVLAPGWTSYENRLLYQTFDVTGRLRDGPNAIGVILGDGWYRGRLGPLVGRENVYGDRHALIAQLEIRYADGSIDAVATDETWRAANGPIVSSSLYDGERYDARLGQPGWAEPGFDDAAWGKVELLEHNLDTLVAQIGPPIRRMKGFSPVAVTISPSGRTIVDFGQNLVGRLRITTEGSAGTTVTLRHAEVLENGELCTRTLSTAAATDRYTLRGGGTETWEPRFTFHGFRYVEVDGWPGNLQPEDLVAVVCHSDMERIGWFECSDPLLQRLHENAVWSMRGNFLGVPTDCPQRDERLGYTGDIQIFAPAASFLYQVGDFLSSWLADLIADQEPSGSVPHVIPDLLRHLPDFEHPTSGAAGWGDAAVIVPWVMYERYGDVGILEAQYESMRAWVEYVCGRAGSSRLWKGDFQIGDWLDPVAPPDNPFQGKTASDLVATAYFARSARLLSRAAGILGKRDDEARYATLAEAVREAFEREYVASEGLLTSDSQTAYALALEFDLLSTAEARTHAGSRLAELVRENGCRIGTGFIGTPLICDALTNAGHDDVAFDLLFQRECPSWLYPVTMGATTIWERWDSMLPDGSVNPGAMTSFNHYALGAVIDWLHRVVGGLAPAEPGYRRLLIQPRPGGGITYARALHATPYGEAEVAWAIENQTLVVDATVPPGSTARVTLPGRDESFDVASGRHRWTISVPKPSQAPSLRSGSSSPLPRPSSAKSGTPSSPEPRTSAKPG